MDNIVRWYIERAYDKKYKNHNQTTTHYKIIKDATINQIVDYEKNELLLMALELAVKDVG